jgi:hypothetical protein
VPRALQLTTQGKLQALAIVAQTLAIAAERERNLVNTGKRRNKPKIQASWMVA